MPYMVTKQSIPAGDAGTRRTLEVMQSLVREGAMSPHVRDMAVKVMRPDKVRAETSIRMLREWLRIVVMFVRDPLYAEALTTPEAMVGRIEQEGRVAGDCDDVAILGAAMALAVGFPARFVVVGFRGTAPLAALDGTEPFLHIWTEVAPPTGRLVWTELDTTRSAQRIPVDAMSRVWIVPIPPGV